MCHAPSRPLNVAAAIATVVILAFPVAGGAHAAPNVAGGAPIKSQGVQGVAAGAPPTGQTVQRVPAAAPAGSTVPPEVVERLKKVGLSPRDPNFGAKLKTLAASTGGAYVKSRVLSTAATRTGRASRAAGRAAGASSVASAQVRRISLPVQGSVDAAYDDTPTLLPIPPTISSTHGKTWPGRYFFLVRTGQKIATKGGPGFSDANVSLSYGCSAQLGLVLAEAAAADDPNWTYGLQKLSPANGRFPYYLSAEFMYLPIGQERQAQATISFENVVTNVALKLEPTPGTATLSVTIDHAPQVTGVGNVYPWGSTNFSGANAKLGASGTPRVGGGDWQTQTQGDDLVGVGVGLGPGWTATSTKISSAVSATSPQDFSPNNQWRGATITTPPQGSDLRTAVHWHYSGIDSLDYTIEWTLAGPMGQRPLLTMAKYGSCDS